jgi:hypothetical protein
MQKTSYGVLYEKVRIPRYVPLLGFRKFLGKFLFKPYFIYIRQSAPI